MLGLQGQGAAFPMVSLRRSSCLRSTISSNGMAAVAQKISFSAVLLTIVVLSSFVAVLFYRRCRAKVPFYRRFIVALPRPAGRRATKNISHFSKMRPLPAHFCWFPGRASNGRQIRATTYCRPKINGGFFGGQTPGCMLELVHPS